MMDEENLRTRDIEPQRIVLSHTSSEEEIQSFHSYLVRKDGKVIQQYDPMDYWWHSILEDRIDRTSVHVGVISEGELIKDGDDFYYISSEDGEEKEFSGNSSYLPFRGTDYFSTFPPEQVESVGHLCANLADRFMSIPLNCYADYRYNPDTAMNAGISTFYHWHNELSNIAPTWPWDRMSTFGFSKLKSSEINISRLKMILQKEGLYEGSIDDTFTPELENGIISYQDRYNVGDGLKGELDKSTLEHMGVI